MANGIVKWYSDRIGVGFISQKNGDDVLMYHSVIQYEGFETLLAGDKVKFKIEKGQNSSRASIVTKV